MKKGDQSKFGLALFVHHNSTFNPLAAPLQDGTYNYSSHVEIYGDVASGWGFHLQGDFAAPDCTTQYAGPGCLVLKRTIADPDEIYFYMLGSRFYKLDNADN